MAKAETTAIVPVTLQMLMADRPAPNIKSEMKTKTMVNRPPTDVMMGPHVPNKIY